MSNSSPSGQETLGTLAVLSLSDLNTAIDQEPRIYDLRLAERLGFARPRAIRQIIERNRAELEAYGPLVVIEENSPHGGAKAPHGVAHSPHGVALSRRGTPGRVYWLNEGQALVVCILSKTPNAAAVRFEVISVFIAFRRGAASTANPAADERFHRKSFVLIDRLKRETDPEVRRFFYQMLEAVSQDMGLTAPPISNLGREAPQQPDLLTPFWARIEALLATGAAINHARSADLLALRLLDLRERHGMEIDGDLREALKLSLSPRFIGQRAVNSVLTGTTVKCWVFARSASGAEG